MENYFKTSVFSPIVEFYKNYSESTDLSVEDFLISNYSLSQNFELETAKELYKNFEGDLLQKTFLPDGFIIEKNSMFYEKAVLFSMILNLNPDWKVLLEGGTSRFLDNIQKFNSHENIRQVFEQADLFNSNIMNMFWWAYFESKLKNDSWNLRKIGVNGEYLTYQYEKEYLNELKIEKDPILMCLKNPSAGYDIKSFRKDKNGNEYEIYIEAKITKTNKNNFFLSRNEFNTLLEKENNYFIYFWNKNGPKDEGSGFNINDISDVELNTKEYYLLVIDSTELISISPKDGKHSQWEKALYDASHLV
jgi:hypothetical protein